MITTERLAELSSAMELEQIKLLYLTVGWINAAEEDADTVIKNIIANTHCFAIARDGERIIGMGRSISDGVSDAYIQDVTVLPEYRTKGIGGQIIHFLVDYLHSHGIGWVGLISEPGYERFYQNLGFAVMDSYTPFIYAGK
jgi:spermidine synthase